MRTRFSGFTGFRCFQFCIVAGLGIATVACAAQGLPATDNLGRCSLHDHVYTCDGAAFQKALSEANSVAVETHNSDGFARSALQKFITQDLHKMIAEPGTSADLVFLMIPTPPEGIVDGGNDAALGTLRIYSAGRGGRGPLLWAETFSGAQDMPWPAVVHRLLLQFQKHFQIK